MKACMTRATSLFVATMVILALTACGGGSSAQEEEGKARPLPQDPEALRPGEYHSVVFKPSLTFRVGKGWLNTDAASPARGAPPQAFPTLTDREREILNLIAQGHPNPSIARQLSLSTKTVGNYVSNIFTKLHVADRAQAIIRAREAGLG
jgi:DNA-binding CsgD family transcriptional regulator